MPPVFGFDITNRSVTLFDEGEVKASVSTWPQVRLLSPHCPDERLLTRTTLPRLAVLSPLFSAYPSRPRKVKAMAFLKISRTKTCTSTHLQSVKRTCLSLFFGLPAPSPKTGRLPRSQPMSVSRWASKKCKKANIRASRRNCTHVSFSPTALVTLSITKARSIACLACRRRISMKQPRLL